MPTDTIRIEGLKDLERQLNFLPEKVAKRILRRATRNAAKLFLDEMKARVSAGVDAEPKHASTGKPRKRLRDSLRIRLKMKALKMAGIVSADVGPSRNVAYIANFLEFGTVKMAARPFMRPAFEAKKAAALAQFSRELGDFIEKEAGK